MRLEGCGADQEDVTIIGDRASKEWGLEKQLNAMEDEWQNVCFDVQTKYRSTGTYILKGADEWEARVRARGANTDTARGVDACCCDSWRAGSKRKKRSG